MKKYSSREIRNVGLVSHSGAGTTMLADAFLYNAKATTRLCRPDDENSTFDFEPEAIKRRSSIATNIGYAEWNKIKINIIDTPGDFNFINDTILATLAMDAAVLVVSAVDGVEVGTEKTWSVINDQGIPRAIFINKIDRERASFAGAIDEIKENLTHSITPLQMPIGSEEDFKGVVDLISGKAQMFKGDSGEVSIEAVPADMNDAFEEARVALVEGVAESDEELMEKYFEEGTLSDDELKGGIAKGIIAGSFIPVFCGAASKNMGVRQLMDFISETFPCPLDRPAVPAVNPEDEEDTSEIKPSEGGGPVGFVFRTMVDPYAGKMTVLRLYAGEMAGDGSFYNASADVTERYGSLNALQGKKLSPVNGADAGDIMTLVKLKETRLGQTVSPSAKARVTIPLPEMMPPIISFVVAPKTQADEEKIGAALQKIMDEDLALKISRDEGSKGAVLSGLGQIHIEMAVERMRRKFNVDAYLSLPRVPYRETIKRKVTNVEGKHKKQSGGRGQFGVCYIDMEPGERGTGFEFVDNIVGGSIPRNWIPSVEKGIREACVKGVLAGFPLVDFRVRLYDGKYHPVDSSDAAFQVAGSKGFKAAVAKADATILEPVMQLEITVPKDSLGDVMGDINSRRGRISGVDEKGKNNVVHAQIPMVEVLRYAPDLKSMTSGRGTFIMTPSHYDEVPAQQREKIIADAARPDDDDDE
jgi:elongation factor G